MSDRPTIFELMSRVQAELPAIGKTEYNQQQKFHFRGIDAVLNALNPLLAKHGVFFVPDVIERVEAVRETRQGAAMYVVNLHVRYRFYGPAGDYVEASAWGEGTDMGDKATPKAMTGAMKACLFQVFAVSTEETADPDASSPEETVVARQRPAPDPALKKVKAQLNQRYNSLPEPAQDRFRAAFREVNEHGGQVHGLRDPAFSQADADVFDELLATALIEPAGGNGSQPTGEPVAAGEA